jgi:hypothetical protein
VKRNLTVLVGGVLALWLLLAIPAQLVWGETALWFSGTAALLCLLPAVGTLLWSQWSFKGSPEQRLAAMMGGTMVRMFLAGGGAMLLFSAVPKFHESAFLIWVLVFYLATLGLEVFLLVREASAEGSTQQQ